MKKFLSGTVLRLILWLVSILIIIPLGWTIVQS
ncbi:carbohydrate ABC transporter permease, partial [Turicibacter sanguinis]|nr:carbohydrate ABC transporter permease [Turicibacter sanguinis]